jgi:hypothetical protein
MAEPERVRLFSQRQEVGREDTADASQSQSSRRGSPSVLASMGQGLRTWKSLSINVRRRSEMGATTIDPDGTKL